MSDEELKSYRQQLLADLSPEQRAEVEAVALQWRELFMQRLNQTLCLKQLGPEGIREEDFDAR